MPRYWITIFRPAGYDPATEGTDMAREIDAVNAEMVAAGVRVFVGGLRPPETARALRRSPDGRLSVADGPHLSAPEQPGGFWVVEARDDDEALAWGRKAAAACRASVEVRPFH